MLENDSANLSGHEQPDTVNAPVFLDNSLHHSFHLDPRRIGASRKELLQLQVSRNN